MRELSVRLNSDTQVVEMWSRPRLGADEWTLHARGRIAQIASPTPTFMPKQDLPHRMTADEVYESARAAGVEYGPSFRRVMSAERSDTLIEIELSAFEERAGLASCKQILHPIALDAAFHAMFENIKLRANERYAYLPVRFAGLRVDQDGAVPARARVAIDRETDDSLSISVSLYAADGAFIAGLTGGLFRAVVLDRRKQSNVFFHQESVRLTRSGGNDDPRTVAAAAVRRVTLAARPDSWLILEAFSRSLAYRRLHALFGTRPALPQSGSGSTCKDLADAALPLALNLFEHLRAAGLAAETDAGWELAARNDLPSPSEILETFAAEYSGATAEIVLAAQAVAGLEEFLNTGNSAPIRSSLLEQFESSSILFAPIFSAVTHVCEALQARIAPEPLRVLVAEPFCLGLLRSLSALVREGRATVTVVGTAATVPDHTAARPGAIGGGAFLEIDGDTDSPGDDRFDLALGFAYGSGLDGDKPLARALARRLVPGGLLCIAQPPDNLIFDLLLGTGGSWFAGSLDPRYPIGRMAAAQNSARVSLGNRLSGTEIVSLGDGAGNMLLATAGAHAFEKTASSTPAILIDDRSPILRLLAQTLRGTGRPIQILPAINPAHTVFDWPAIVARARTDDLLDLILPTFTADTLDYPIAALTSILAAVQTGQCRLWILMRGLDSASPDAIDPIAEAVWCFARVAMNEYPSVEIKLVDIALELNEQEAVRHLAGLIAAPSPDAELLITASGVSAVRVIRGLGGERTEEVVPTVRLAQRTKGVLAHFDWVEAHRRDPGPAEVEVEIAAAGLNFRDIMLATGLLDDDVLDDGLAGAVFGFECAGRLVRVGTQVTGLKLGDSVMGFGRESFATHCTADARLFAPLPKGFSLEAGASTPVAFLTAWYALVQLAQLQAGEWVLIHGAAGGVGLAAMQIARLRGARIAATVSSPDKRALVELFGAEKVYNSRSIAFLDAIRADLGGVDVVLNSLAGDAMAASIKCLKPFGRFIELGKRDYVLNTALGLRPFRRNLTYYGVDLDQLLAANLPLAHRLMGDLVRHFDSGELSALPYRAFDWHEASEAFRLMQGAGHVGKLIVRPASRPVATAAAQKSFQPGPGAHLVVGGGGGFGFETAAWLASKGAATVVIASRRGRIEPQLRARAQAIEAAGTKLIVETLDVTDPVAVQALVAKLTGAHGRLAGVIHSAMVLDDGLIAGLTPARTRAVLAPKVDGIHNLDRATRDSVLDYFVAFSSATTLIGNPGQGAYVAANGYMQGCLRRRRAAGFPGFAVAWGAISDAGILARERDIAAKLERASGIVAMRADEALSHLDRLLSQPSSCPPTVYCATLRPEALLQGLKLLQTPLFAQLFSDGGSEQEVNIDLATLVAGKSEVEARASVTGLVASEVGRVLRLAAEEINVALPLDEIGLDSLMSLELRLGIEQRFGVELPIVAIGSGISVNDLVSRLLSGLQSSQGGRRVGDVEQRLMRQHGADDLILEDLLAVTDAIEERRSSVKLL